MAEHGHDDGDEDATGRERRIVENEVLYREVNEAIGSLAAAPEAAGALHPWICECGDATCAERVLLSRGEYEAVRADPIAFFVLPGHEIPDVETVVLRTPRYHVVRKDTLAGRRGARGERP